MRETEKQHFCFKFILESEGEKLPDTGKPFQSKIRKMMTGGKTGRFPAGTLFPIVPVLNGNPMRDRDPGGAWMRRIIKTDIIEQ